MKAVVFGAFVRELDARHVLANAVEEALGALEDEERGEGASIRRDIPAEVASARRTSG